MSKVEKDRGKVYLLNVIPNKLGCVVLCSH